MIRVCFVCPNAASIFFPDLPVTHGGAEAQLSWFARELATRRDFDVHFVLRGEAGRPAEQRDGLTLHFTPHQAGLRQKLRLQRLLWRIGADIYLEQGHGSLPKEIAFFRLWSRKHFVYWVAHDFDLVPPQGMALSRRLFLWGMLRASGMITQTTVQQETLKRRFGRDSVLIRNACPARPPSDLPRRNILWIGRFVPVKRPELFIDLARRMPSEDFLMVAPLGNAEAREYFAKHEDAIRSTPNLTFVPGVPLSETDALFDRARLLVLTSKGEGYPNTIMQAMWAGTPIATYDFDPDGIVASRELGVSVQGDWDGFVDEIRSLLDDKARLATCRLRAHAFATEHHDIEKNTGALCDYFRELGGRVR
ncbi:MAG: glycosyltransferase family 4 protein [Candidatus Sumerlaeota bacterium]